MLFFRGRSIYSMAEKFVDAGGSFLFMDAVTHDFGIVVSDQSADRSTTENEACYVDPTSPNKISAGMRRISCSAVLTAVIWLGCAYATFGQERPTDELRKLNESVQALIKSVSPAVVQILVTGFGTVGKVGTGIPER